MATPKMFVRLLLKLSMCLLYLQLHSNMIKFLADCKPLDLNYDVLFMLNYTYRTVSSNAYRTHTLANILPSAQSTYLIYGNSYIFACTTLYTVRA